MLEDDFTYVLKKALLGHDLAPTGLAERAGVAESEVLSLLRGTFSSESARRIAPVLGLNPAAFAVHSEYLPQPLVSSSVERIDLPFGDERVNAWIIRLGESLVLIDAGFQASDLMDALQSRCGRLPDRVFITHEHRDHIGAVSELLEKGVPVHASGIEGTIDMKPADTVFCGSLAIRACDLSGHCTPTLGFHLEGLGQPVLVTGDAVFAGSIGGCKTPEIYQHALRSIRDVMTGLPANTILLPGHGPATTLGEERISNPFL
jgi:glyoxylase-like metal-dependent hydrolase (beta-lactamase superfamily II)